MTARFVSLYVRCFFVLELMFMAFSLFLHVSALLGTDKPFAEYGKALLYCTLVISIPVSGLAEDRNVWKHEFKSCPRWLQIASLIFMIYGMAVAFVQAMSFSNGDTLSAQPLFASSVSLLLGSMSVCILYSLLLTHPVSAPELVKRVRISVIMLAVCAVVIVAARLGYLPHRSRQE